MAVIYANNWFSSIYFVLWIVLGNYILLTLFLAVVMEAFEGKYDIESKETKKKRTKLTQIAARLRRTAVGHTNPNI
eukprot:1194388-Prorocentrum_minimum.AAC.3